MKRLVFIGTTDMGYGAQLSFVLKKFPITCCFTFIQPEWMYLAPIQNLKKKKKKKKNAPPKDHECCLLLIAFCSHQLQYEPLLFIQT